MTMTKNIGLHTYISIASQISTVVNPAVVDGIYLIFGKIESSLDYPVKNTRGLPTHLYPGLAELLEKTSFIASTHKELVCEKLGVNTPSIRNVKLLLSHLL